MIPETPQKKKKKNNREAARAAAGSRQDTKSNVEDLPVHSAGMARSCVMTQLVILPAHRMVQDIITDHFAPRGENCCNSNFL